MQVSTSIEINGAANEVWSVVSDIEHSDRYVSAINKIEVLEKPEGGLVGFKWKETRTLFGKEASEIMWITDSVENQYYETRAESHGSVYISRISLEERNEKTLLTMSFEGTPQSLVAKIVSGLLSVMMKSSIKKELDKDLNDIKQYIEKANT